MLLSCGTPPERQTPSAARPGDTVTGTTADTLAIFAETGVRLTAPSKTLMCEIVALFRDKPTICGVILVDDDGVMLGVCGRDAVAQAMTQPFGHELYRRRSVAHFVERFMPASQCLILPATTSVAAAAEAALRRPDRLRYAPVMVEQPATGDRFLLDVQALLVEQCQMLTRTVEELKEQRRVTQEAQRERELLTQRLLDTSREAGRAEVATGVLHNVGNVLNSVNASASLMRRTLQQSKLPGLQRATALMRENQDHLGEFLTSDERGTALPGYLAKLTDVLNQEHTQLADEMAQLNQSLEHIKSVVQMQQSYARSTSIVEPVVPSAIMEDALRLNAVSFDRHNVKVERRFDAAGAVVIDRHKVLQILVNIVRNAKDATKHNEASNRLIVLRTEMIEREGERWVRFRVTDNGVGIPAENLTRIFSHGFTTRKDGHGFGLHSAANTARELGGMLSAASEGTGKGAMFTLELPVKAVPAELVVAGDVR